MTTPTNPVGDAVRFVDDERLDIPDARALQTLIYEYMADALGGLMGETSGALTDITFTTGNNAAIGIGECTLCGFKRRTDSSARVRGGIFHYDPTSNYQAGSATVDLSAYVAGTDNAFLWFRRVELPADLATRHKYDSTAEREKTFAMNTKYRTKLAFGASNDRDTPPNELYDWFVFAQVISWNATVPTIQPVHPFDVGIVPSSLTGSVTPFLGDAFDQAYPNANGLGSYQRGLAQWLTFYSQRLTEHQDSAWILAMNGTVSLAGTQGLSQVPARGLKQLDADLTTAEATLASTSLSSLAASRVIYSALITFNSGTNNYGITREFLATGASSGVDTNAHGIGYKASVTVSSPGITQGSHCVQVIDSGMSSLSTNGVYPITALSDPAVLVANTSWRYDVVFRNTFGTLQAGNSFAITVFGGPV